MAGTFDDAQIQLATAFYEQLPFTYWIASLPISKSLVTQARDIVTATSGKKLAYLSRIASSQATNVNLMAQAGADSQLIATNTFASNLVPIMTEENDGYRSAQTLSLNLINNSGTAVANFQMNYLGAVKTLTTADKVLRNLPLTPQDQALAHKYQIGKQGFRPLALSRMLEQVWYSRILTQEVRGYYQNVSSTATTLANVTPGADELLVLTEIAIGGVTLGNQVTLTVQRDDNVNYVSILGDNMSLSQPFPVWIPATRGMSFGLSSITANNNVAVRLTLAHLRLSTVLRVMTGIMPMAELQGQDANLYEQILAGVVV